ncbi:ankyrin repeat protein [Lentinula edodes]|nr:ankyrin repeat protein [Lentinula edodes]
MHQNSEAQAFIDRVLALPKGPGVSLESVLQPSLDDEAALRRLFATEKDNNRLKNPYVGLVNVFDAPPDIRTIRARIVKDEEDLNGKYVMPLSPKDRKAEGTACMVPSLEEFQKNWAVFSEGSLSQLLDWSNVVAAGGSVLACLVPLPEEAKVSKRAIRKYYHGSAYPSSDIDLFLWGLTPQQAEAKIVTIYEAVRDSVPWDVTCVRTKHTVSIHSQYPYRSVQIVLRLYTSPAEILAGFDIDAPCCAYDGRRIWANPRAITALMRQCNTIDVTRRSPSYEVRLTKYSSRAFEIYVPNLCRADIDPTIYERSIVRVEGLARLLVFEKLKYPNAREIFLQSRRTLRGRSYANSVPYYIRKKRTLKGDLKNEVAIGGLEMNSYDVVSLHIPYGPGWDARKIDKLIYQTDLGMNSTFNPKNKNRRLHRHPAFFGTIEECLEDCCEDCPKPIDEDEVKLQEEEDKQYLRGRISFVQQDPGRQSLSGSFNPIDDSEWSAQVFIGPTEKFFQVIITSDRAAVARMIAEGVDVNRRDHVGRMPLHVAVLAKAEDVACDLIDAGARITSRLAEGKTALHIAAQLDQLKVVKKLLERSKINEDLLKKDGDAEEGNGDVEMKEAVRDSSEDDWSSADDGVISMEEVEDTDVDDEDDGDDVDDDNGDDNDGSPRKKTKSKGVSEPPKAPTEYNALPEDDSGEPDVFDINAPDWDLCFTPLSYAILFASLPVIDTLLLNGADANLATTASYPDAPRLHPLLLTVYHSDEEQACSIAERLLQAGAASSAADQGRTILYKMIEAGKTKLVNSLLRLDPKAGVVLNLPSMNMNNGRPTFPLIAAVQINNLEMVTTLLAYGANVVFKAEDVVRAQELRNQQNYGNNVSHFINFTLGEPLDQVIHPVEAALCCHSDLIQLLVSVGASINRATRVSTSTYANQEILRTYLDWARYAIGWITRYISEQQDKMKLETKKLDSITTAPTTPWRTFVSRTIYLSDNGVLPGSELQKKKFVEDQVELEKTIRKCVALKGFFGDAERLLVSKGAKTYNILFADTEKRSTATSNVSIQIDHHDHILWQQNSSSTKYFFLGQHDYSREAVPMYLNDRYDELFEACWKGDDIAVRKLCLPDEGKENALKVSVAVAHPTNQWLQTNLTPLVAAIEGRHWSTVRLVFGICVAQYKPVDEKEVAFRLNNINLDEDDEDNLSDDDSAASDVTASAQKRNQPFIDIAQISPAVKVPFPPSRLLNSHYVTYEEGGGSLVLIKAIKTKDFEAFVHIADLYKLTEPPLELGQGYILDAILAADEPEMLDEYIRRTGSGIDLQSHGDETEEKEIRAINDKNKIYLGLSVHGKKRKDLAQKNDPANFHYQLQDQDVTPILWRAILSSSKEVKIIEYLASTRPLEAYRFYAMTHGSELSIRLRRITDLEQILPDRLGWCTNNLGESPLVAAILSNKLNVIKLLFAKKPKLMSAALKERMKFSGFNLLMLAVQVGCDPQVIDFLLANGQSPTETDQIRKWNIYHMLAASSVPVLFEHLLLKLPRDVNELLLQQHCKGNLDTPLHLAVSRGDYRTSSIIIDYTRAGLAIRNVYGSIPLHIAISKSQAKTVKKLIDSSPEECLFMENGVGNTPLEMATLLDLLGRLQNVSRDREPELAAQHVNLDPSRITLDKLQQDVPNLRQTINTLLKNGPLKVDDKLTKELFAFSRFMETKLTAATAEAEATKRGNEDEPDVKDKWKDPEDRGTTLKIIKEAILARPHQRQLIHLVDVQKSVGSHLSSAELRSTDTHNPRHQREHDEEGLEPEEDTEIKLRNSSIVYRRLGQPLLRV